MGRRWAALLSVTCAAALVAAGAAVLAQSEGVSERRVAGFGTVAAEVSPDHAAVRLPGPVATISPVAPGTLPDPAVPAAAEVGVAEDPSQPDLPVPDLPIRRGVLASLQAPPPPAPVGLRIGSIAVDAPVEPVGYDAGRDAMEVPRSRAIVGWYQHGPTPGEDGSAVLAAHVDWNGQPGPFFALSEVADGATIVVAYDDGSERRFRATALGHYPKSDLPVDRLFAKDGPAVLTLITCGGSFDSSVRSYRDNVVLQAVEIPPGDAVPPA